MSNKVGSRWHSKYVKILISPWGMLKEGKERLCKELPNYTRNPTEDSIPRTLNTCKRQIKHNANPPKNVQETWHTACVQGQTGRRSCRGQPKRKKEIMWGAGETLVDIITNEEKGGGRKIKTQELTERLEELRKIKD